MCVGLHVSWPSVAGVSLALGKSESVSRLDMRSSSACTSLRPSLEPVLRVGRCTQTFKLVQYHRENYHRGQQAFIQCIIEWLRHNAISTITHG